MRTPRAAALALLSALALAGCGGGSAARPEATEPDPGPIRMALTGVGSLDPARAVTAQETELSWALYTGLLTYRHARGHAGTELIPGLAAAMPRITDAGRLYTVTLRRGMRFSDGRPLRARDVIATFERTLRTLDSPVRPLLLRVLAGGEAFAEGTARRISGLAADDAAGRVTIRLERADPAFDALLAEPALGIVAPGTPVRGRPGHPPIGIGPYRLRRVRAGRSFSLVRNPFWDALPGLPAGQVDVQVTLTRDASANAFAVLNDVLDVADPVAALPEPTTAEILRAGAGRARLLLDGRPIVFVFLGTSGAPFDRRLAREGVIDGLGALAPGQTASRSLPAICDLVPLTRSAPAPAGCTAPGVPAGALGTARGLVQRSGTAGAPVTLWSPRTGVTVAWLQEEAAILRSLGYAVQITTLPNATYHTDVAALAASALTAPASGSTRSGSQMRLSAAHQTSRIPRGAVAAVVDGRVAAIDHAAPRDPLIIALGPSTTFALARRSRRLLVAQPAVPELMSWRMNAAAAVVNPVEGLDITSLRLR